MGLPPLDSDIKLLAIKRDIRHSGTSSIYEINLGSNRYAMKLVGHRVALASIGLEPNTGRSSTMRMEIQDLQTTAGI